MSQIDPTRVDNQIFIQNARWAEPSEKDAKKRLRKLYSSYETPLGWAKELGPRLRESLSHEKICEHLDAHMSGLDL